jgi:hypothetical protein
LNTFDGRTLTGLKNAVERLYQRKEKDHSFDSAYNMLKGYYVKIQVSLELREVELNNKDWPGVLGVVAAAVKEGVPLIVATRYYLVARYTKVVLASQSWFALVQVIIPIGSSLFNPTKPLISALDIGILDKVKLFEDTLGLKVLVVLFGRGQPAAATVVELTVSVLKDFGAVDPFTCEKELTDTVRRTGTIGRTADAIYAKRLDPSFVVTRPALRIHNNMWFVALGSLFYTLCMG